MTIVESAAITGHAPYQKARPKSGPEHDITVRAALSKEALIDADMDMPEDTAMPIVKAFLAHPMSLSAVPSKLRAAIAILAKTLAAARKKHALGENIPKLKSFDEYRTTLSGSDSAHTELLSALDAALTEADRLIAIGGLARQNPDGTVHLPQTIRGPDAVTASVRSISAAELIAARESVARSARSADPSLSGRDALSMAENTAEKAGLTTHWTERKNADILCPSTLELMDSVRPSRRSVDIYNRLLPITPIVMKVIKLTPAVASLWLDTIGYARRQGKDLSDLLDIESPGDIVRSMTAMSGLTRSAWKRLAKSDHKLIAELIDECRRPDFHEGNSPEPILHEQYRWRKPIYDLMRLQAAHGRSVHPTAQNTVWNALFQMNDHGEYPTHPDAYQNLALAFFRHADMTQKPSRQEFLNILDWANHQINQVGLAEVPKRTWEHYRLMSERWHLENNPLLIYKMSKEEKRELSWRSALKTFTTNNYTVRPLTSQIELEKEAQTMKNCVGYGYYAGRCKQGVNRIFHIERTDKDHQSPTPVATVQIVDNAKNGKWRIGQIQGPTLTKKQVPKRAKEIAAELPAKYAAAERGLTT